MKIAALTLSAALLTLGALPAQAARGRWHDRQHERRDDWKTLGVLRATGADDTLVLDRRTGRIDDLRIEATRGVVNVRNLVVTTVDGRRFVLPVHQQLRPGNAQTLDLPGPAQRIASVELQYAGSRGGFWRRAFFGNADIAMFGR
jgi:hypothetical protein